MAGQQGRLSYADGDRRRRRTDRAGPRREDFWRGPADRPLDPQVRLLRHAAVDAVRSRDRRLAAKPFRGCPPHPRILGGTVSHHVLSRASLVRGNRVGRLRLRRLGGDAPTVPAPIAPRGMDDDARWRADLLHRQSGAGALGAHADRLECMLGRCRPGPRRSWFRPALTFSAFTDPRKPHGVVWRAVATCCQGSTPRGAPAFLGFICTGFVPALALPRVRPQGGKSLRRELLPPAATP